jgi:hypothetical protein
LSPSIDLLLSIKHANPAERLRSSADEPHHLWWGFSLAWLKTAERRYRDPEHGVRFGQISLAPLDPCVGRDTPVERFSLAVDDFSLVALNGAA